MNITEIKHLIFQNIVGQATEGEKARLQMWLEESEENRALYEKLSGTHFLGKAITDQNSRALREVWRNIEKRTDIPSANSKRVRRSWIAAAVAIPLIAAATVFAVLTLGDGGTQTAATLIRPGTSQVVVTLPNGDEMHFDRHDRMIVMADGVTHLVNESNVLSVGVDGQTSPEEYTTYKIPSGGEYTIKLDDGTIVTMNAESELRAPVKFTGSQRKVYFTGEGYFEVAKDASRQFIVATDRADIAVLGTEFNIRAYADDAETIATLVEGSVNIISPSETSVTMVPGTQARVSDNGNVSVVAVDVYPHIAWKSGRIVFENESMENIMKVLTRWYNFEVVYSDDRVRNRSFTMDILKYDDITRILELMRRINVEYEIDGKKIYLRSK